jgi:glycosyltransferase involved in cell wall biosynthesis
MTDNRFSVLMSVYKNDDADYLKFALESIYDKQTRRPDEVVVVFDGPLTDSLYSVLDSFRKGREDVIKYYPQEVNRGLGEALRIGSELCSGDYLLRMDSDDVSAPNRFEKQITFVEAHPEIDALGTDIAEFQESPDEGGLRTRVCPAKHEDILRMMKRRNPMNHVTACIKKSALMKAGGYQSLLLLEDYLLWINMAIVGCRLANLNEPLVYVRVGNGFDGKRGAKERIKGWGVLQQRMLEGGLICKWDAFVNKFFIRVFVHTPSWLKKILYNHILRH